MRGVLEKVGVEPQVKRIGKYKSAGDQLLRRDMSEPQREQLTALLEDYARPRPMNPAERQSFLQKIFALSSWSESGSQK